MIELGNVQCSGKGRERDKKNFDKRCNWYKRRYHEAVMFVEATPNGQLAKTYRKALKEARLKIRVVERVGKSMKKMITKSDPFREGQCNQNKYKMYKLDSSTNRRGMKCIAVVIFVYFTL